MPWYRRKILWVSLIALIATLVERYVGLPLSDDVKAALLDLIAAIAGQPLQ